MVVFFVLGSKMQGVSLADRSAPPCPTPASLRSPFLASSRSALLQLASFSNVPNSSDSKRFRSNSGRVFRSYFHYSGTRQALFKSFVCSRHLPMQRVMLSLRKEARVVPWKMIKTAAVQTSALHCAPALASVCLLFSGRVTRDFVEGGVVVSVRLELSAGQWMNVRVGCL